ncbi:hypothetical protein predicted by Glimmer/Critica (plasmid) [Sinorhizobium fredii HH103]|uniref:Uncharacterized protein n=1 Tax=Sinorhizobium fredii (strain HH103) TaxID=1117943 RepID=G9AJ30_SINF1|nr:hypothetical protein predicted by Glimmer/Critica [Sinorhizobium fredii HH103]
MPWQSKVMYFGRKVAMRFVLFLAGICFRYEQ